MFLHCQTTDVIAKQQPRIVRVMRRKREFFLLAALLLSFTSTCSSFSVKPSSARADTIDLSRQKGTTYSSKGGTSDSGGSIDEVGKKSAALLSDTYIPVYVVMIAIIAGALAWKQQWLLAFLTILFGAIIAGILFDPMILAYKGKEIIDRVF